MPGILNRRGFIITSGSGNACSRGHQFIMQCALEASFSEAAAGAGTWSNALGAGFWDLAVLKVTAGRDCQCFSRSP